MAKKRIDRDDDKNMEKGVVLITRFSALGDVAMTLPPIYDSCMSNPGRGFVFVTRKHPAKMFINPPANLTIYPIDTDDYAGVAGIRRLYKELRNKYNITAYADLHDVLRTKILRMFFRTGGVKVVKVDKDRGARSRLTRRHRKHLIPLRPMGLRYADTLSAAGVAGRNVFKSIFPDGASQSLFDKASKPKNDGEKWIGIAPFARHEGKIYPAHLMEDVIKGLIKDKDVKIFVFGFGESEKETICGWRDRVSVAYPDDDSVKGRIVNMAEKNIGLPAELALISYCDVMLSMDSANMHFASLVDTRVVSIWGATHPYCGFRPSNVSEEDILQLDMVCRPCSVFGNKKCRFGDYHCLNGITPERVVERVLGVRF